MTPNPRRISTIMLWDRALICPAMIGCGDVRTAVADARCSTGRPRRKQPPSRMIARGRLSIDVHRHSNARPGVLWTSKSVFAFSLRVWTISAPIFPGTGQTPPSGSPTPVVGDDDTLAVLTVAHAFDRDHAAVAATEGIFEGVGQKLVHDKSH